MIRAVKKLTLGWTREDLVSSQWLLRGVSQVATGARLTRRSASLGQHTMQIVSALLQMVGLATL
jgi:hypothetical protein